MSGYTRTGDEPPVFLFRLMASRCSGAGGRERQLMGAGQHLRALAPVQRLQQLAGGLGRILGAAGVVREELRYGLVCTPDAALHAGDVGADGTAVELVFKGLPGGQILDLPGPCAASVTALVVDRAAELIGKDALDVAPELGGGAGRCRHGTQLSQTTGEALALHVDQTSV